MSAAEAAKAKLLAKKKSVRGPGRPPKEKPEIETTEQVEPVVEKKKFNITPRLVTLVYSQLGNGLARSWKADTLSKAELDEFEAAYKEWIELENFTVDPVWAARAAFGTAILSPILFRHPKFEKLLDKFLTNLDFSGEHVAEQNNDNTRT